MKNLKTIALLTGLLIAGFGFQAAAQNRAEKTSSAKAYYGHPPEKSKFKKKKKQKPVMVHHTRPASGTHIDPWSSRKKYSRS
jgi:dienelactone hydrolase